MKQQYKFSSAIVDYYFSEKVSFLKKIVDPKKTIIITDENIFKYHSKKFKEWKLIILKPGETYKIQATVDSIIKKMIEMNADRKTTLIGVGGGVVTDITGYAASVYLRGIDFGFLPTTLLAMVDASIGGKNGIDVDNFKNMVGVIRQPKFILYDLNFLKTLSQSEWRNGFAEIIKHACIKDAASFSILEKQSIKFYQKNSKALSELVVRNVLLKTKLVQRDEFEKGERMLLNFGHTIGHALEMKYELSHGQAISIGMTYASLISEKELGFKGSKKLVNLLTKYELPTFAEFDNKKIFEILKKDKKRVNQEINYVFLKKLGVGVVQSISLKKLEKLVQIL